jgi:hypothetical protein
MDHRAVPIDTLREFARDRAEMSSVRQVAGEVGLGRTTLHNFISEETTPHPRVRRLLALWYLREQQKEEKPATTAASAVEILLNGIPPEQREGARAALVQTLSAIHTAAGAPPQWLNDLRQAPSEK